MLRNTLQNSLLASLMVAGAAQAQCSNLAATVTAGDVTLDLTGGGSMALAVYLVGDTTGATTVNLGAYGTLTLGLAPPFVPAPGGLTDLNGDNSLMFTVPMALTGTYYAQAVTVGFDFTPGTGLSLDFCESNVATITL